MDRPAVSSLIAQPTLVKPSFVTVHSVASRWRGTVFSDAGRVAASVSIPYLLCATLAP